MYHIAIVDDNSIDADCVLSHLKKYEKENSLQFHIDCFHSGLDFLSSYSNRFDIVFMDIDMPGMDGLQTADQLRNMDQFVALIFLTNMADYAIKGYQFHASAYLLKPLSYYCFAATMLDCMKYVKKQMHQTTLLLPSNGELYRISSDDILYIDVQEHRLTYYLTELKISTWGSLKKVQAMLPDADFVRCNSCYLINLRHVRSVKKETVTVGPYQLTISQAKRKNFLERLNQFYTGGF